MSPEMVAEVRERERDREREREKKWWLGFFLEREEIYIYI